MRICSMVVAVMLVGVAVGCSYEPQDGDIIFQISESRQSEAVQCATRSEWSHMGLVFLQGGKPMVLEAGKRVQAVSLPRWIEHGKNDEYVVYRLKDDRAAGLATVSARLKTANRFLDKPYDIYFEPSDTAFYCSELVWKIYQEELGIELAPLERFGDFDLECEAVAAIIKVRWPAGPPLDMEVISPRAILESPLLKQVGP